MSALVTGGAGHIGAHLTNFLAQRGEAVIVLDLSVPPAVSDDQVRYIRGDLEDIELVSQVITGMEVNTVYHLAGMNAQAAPLDIYRTNVLGTASVLQALENSRVPNLKLLVMSSSAVYGNSADDPIVEQSALAPMTHYGISKMSVEQMCRMAVKEAGLHVVIARPFNVIGPGQRSLLLHSAVASQLARIEYGLQPPKIALGRLDSFRDFIDVRDVASGLFSIAECGNSGETYNLCSGIALEVHSMVEALVRLSGVHAEVCIDDARQSGLQVRSQRGSFDALNRRAGWTPKVSLENSLADTLQFWRDEICAKFGKPAYRQSPAK